MRRPQWKRSVQAAIVAGIAVLGSLPALPASAEPSAIPLAAPDGEKRIITSTEQLSSAAGVTPELLALMKVQQGLDELADDIRAKSSSGTASSGLSSLVVEPERNMLRLYWHGAVPAAVTQSIAAARGRGMAVAVRPAPYTEAQLQAEVDRISMLRLWTGTATSQRVMTAMPRPDGTGIVVGVGGLPAGTTPAQARRMVPALDSTFPLTVEVGAPVEPAARWLDSPAYWGGGYMQRWVNNQVVNHCSNAFGVTGDNGAASYLLTAAHCGEGQWRTGQIEAGGTIFQNIYGNTIPGRDLQRDGAAIHTPAGAGAAVFHGRSVNPNNGDVGTNDALRVFGANGSVIGDIVCTSGSFSGTVCGARVTGTGPVVFDPPVNGVGRMPSMVNARHDSIAVAGNGDSGGPVYSIRTSDSRAVARGVISAIDLGGFLRPCQGWVLAGRQCSLSVWYGDVRSIMTTLGVHINVS
jgi:streptogrisin D